MAQKLVLSSAAALRARARLGGLAVLRKYGHSHFSTIGRRGAATFWRRYKFAPVGTSQFAVIRRRDGVAVAFLSGIPF